MPLQCADVSECTAYAAVGLTSLLDLSPSAELYRPQVSPGNARSFYDDRCRNLRQCAEVNSLFL